GPGTTVVAQRSTAPSNTESSACWQMGEKMAPASGGPASGSPASGGPESGRDASGRPASSSTTYAEQALSTKAKTAVRRIGSRKTMPAGGRAGDVAIRA